MAQKVFNSTSWGISMEVPGAWFRMSEAETNQNTDENVRLDSAQIQAILKIRSNNILLLSLCKFRPETHTGIIPTIKINVLKNPAPDFDAFTEMTRYLIDKWFKLMKNGSYTVAPQQRTISNVAAIYSEISFTIDVAGTGPTSVQTLTAFVPMKGYMIQIAFMSAGGDKETDSLYRKLISTIHIDPSKYRP